MDNIAAVLIEKFTTLGPFILLLGVLIFIHELGHFAVAKFYGVRVEVFSIGFGKRILAKKIGDTLYCVSIFPLGGYVKMFGDDPLAEVPSDQREFSFKDKPVWPRIAIVLAGPMMNFFLAGVLFFVLAVIGEQKESPIVGDVDTFTEAYSLGFRAEDKITAVNGNQINRWEVFQKSVEANLGKSLTVTISRDGKDQNIDVIPKAVPNKNPLSSESLVGGIDGLNNYYRAASVAVPNPESEVYKTGLRTFDLVEKVNGIPVTRWLDFSKVIQSETEKNVKTTTLQIHREGGKDPVTFSFNISPTELLKQIETSDLYLSFVDSESVAAQVGFRPGDKIVAINDTKVERWENLTKNVTSYQPGSSPLKIQILRNGAPTDILVTPRLKERKDRNGITTKQMELGVMNGMKLTPPKTFIFKQSSTLEVMKHGFEQTIYWTKITGLSYLRLIQGHVSAKSLGGPIMIYKLANDTWEIGVSAFIKLMSIISLNLFLLNLLPIPVLDGGYLVLFTVEALKGTPLSFKKVEILQQVGLVLLLGLMVFAIFNDIVNTFFS